MIIELKSPPTCRNGSWWASQSCAGRAGAACAQLRDERTGRIGALAHAHHTHHFCLTPATAALTAPSAAITAPSAALTVSSAALTASSATLPPPSSCAHAAIGVRSGDTPLPAPHTRNTLSPSRSFSAVFFCFSAPDALACCARLGVLPSRMQLAHVSRLRTSPSHNSLPLHPRASPCWSSTDICRTRKTQLSFPSSTRNSHNAQRPCSMAS